MDEDVDITEQDEVFGSEPPWWISADGKRYHLNYMKASHMVNCVDTIKRLFREYADGLRAGHSMSGILQGEMASLQHDRDLELAEQEYYQLLVWGRTWLDAFAAELQCRSRVDARTEGQTIVYFDKETGKELHRSPL